MRNPFPTPYRRRLPTRREQAMSSTEATAHIGVVGLAVMGRNLARNIARQGYSVAIFNRSRGRTDDLMDSHGDEGSFVPAIEIGRASCREMARVGGVAVG